MTVYYVNILHVKNTKMGAKEIAQQFGPFPCMWSTQV